MFQGIDSAHLVYPKKIIQEIESKVSDVTFILTSNIMKDDTYFLSTESYKRNEWSWILI